MQCRLLVRDESTRLAARALGITDYSRKYSVADMVKGEVMFAATGITDGPLLRGVRRRPGSATTHSLVVRSSSGSMRYIEGLHDLANQNGLNRLGR